MSIRFIERRAVDPALKGLGLPAREDQTSLPHELEVKALKKGLYLKFMGTCDNTGFDPAQS